MKNIFLAFSIILAVSCTPVNDTNTEGNDDENGNTNTIVTEPGTPITDVSGNTYQTIKIGTQTWMAENLKTTKFRNGVTITEAQSTASWMNATDTPKYCKYNNNADSSAIYGLLYDGNAAYSTNNIAPTGWRVATIDDWNTLIAYLGGSTVVGGKLKETGFNHWLSPNTAADNASGFKALGAGCRFPSGFESILAVANWWVGNSAATGVLYSIFYHNDNIDARNSSKEMGYSIRCIKE